MLLLLSLCYAVLAQRPTDHKLPNFNGVKGPFTDQHGELVNQRDSTFHCFGRHYLTNYGVPEVSDTVEYWCGIYDGGWPTGLWTHHLPDGTYSQGYYSCSDWIPSDGVHHPFCFRGRIKDGVWHYYDRDSTLLRTERYTRYYRYQKCGIDSIFLVGPQGRETLLLFHWRKDTHHRSSFFYQRGSTYNDEGHLLTTYVWNRWRDRSTTYFANGRVKRTWRATVLLGIHLNRSVTTDYSEDGKNKVRTVGKVWTSERIVE